ncbi:flagellar hook-associated protein FlgL [Brevibacillus laterosporus]|uniref:flagellar hook-associated protein FlgL n=1 Tax=Brevibacillus laterosporus TaxID=1465 RepID=UPI003D19193D
MRISHNITALQANNHIKKNIGTSSKNLNKLSSGLRINSASDDAAGLGISEKMRAQIRGLQQASRNSQDGISLIQTAEGALSSIGDHIQRMRELAVQSANGIYEDSDRQHIQDEINQLKESINQISSFTEFNGTNLLDGSLERTPLIPPSSSIDVTTGGMGKTIADGDIAIGTYGAVVRINPDEYINSDENYGLSIEWFNGTPKSFTIKKVPSGDTVVSNHTETTFSINGITFDISGATSGIASGSQTQGVVLFHPGNNSEIPAKDNSLVIHIGSESGQSMKIDIDNYNLNSLKISDLAVTPREKALEALKLTENALNKVLEGRAKLGANQNRLEYAINNLENQSTNITAAESRIRDVDMAKEMMQYTKNNILLQASQAMLAQANSTSQNILSIIK